MSVCANFNDFFFMWKFQRPCVHVRTSVEGGGVEGRSVALSHPGEEESSVDLDLGSVAKGLGAGDTPRRAAALTVGLFFFVSLLPCERDRGGRRHRATHAT